MYAIFKKNYHFIKDKIVTAKGLEATRTIEAEWKPNLSAPNYQEAPAWIKETDLFKLAAKDKMIIEVVPVDNGTTDESKAPVRQPTPTGWQTGQGSGLTGQN